MLPGLLVIDTRCVRVESLGPKSELCYCVRVGAWHRRNLDQPGPACPDQNKQHRDGRHDSSNAFLRDSQCKSQEIDGYGKHGQDGKVADGPSYPRRMLVSQELGASLIFEDGKRV